METVRLSRVRPADAGDPVGLVLMGGGARAGYQVGALSAVLEILDPGMRADFPSPFSILCGTSAGAINATALACRAHRPHLALRRLRRLWGSLSSDMVYRADAPGLIGTGARWLGLLSVGWMLRKTRGPRSLLDNTPLAGLLARTLNFRQLEANMTCGMLTALAVTASGYTSGEHLTFYQSSGSVLPWHRSLRRAVPARIGIDHLMASSAIPLVFPARAVPIGDDMIEWCGDGSMRHLAPVSPAIHLGARRVMVIRTGFQGMARPEALAGKPPYPTLAQVGGHALASIFLDSLPMDVERLEVTNELIGQGGGPPGGAAMRPVEVLTLAPSRSLDALALEHLGALPPEARALLRVIGVSADPGREGGAALLSYLLFESSYTRQLIELGYADTMRRIDEVTRFFQEARA